MRFQIPVSHQQVILKEHSLMSFYIQLDQKRTEPSQLVHSTRPFDITDSNSVADAMGAGWKVGDAALAVERRLLADLTSIIQDF